MIKQTVIRIDEELYKELSKIAKENERSVNREMVLAIKKHLKDIKNKK